MRFVLGGVRRTHPSREASHGRFVAQSTSVTKENSDWNWGKNRCERLAAKVASTASDRSAELKSLQWRVLEKCGSFGAFRIPEWSNEQFVVDRQQAFQVMLSTSMVTVVWDRIGGEKEEVGILGMFSHRETSFRMRRRITESSNIDCYRYHFHTPTHHTSLSTCSAPPSSALRESPHNLVPALLQSLAQLFAAPSSHPESPAQRPESLRYGVMPAHRDLDKRRLLAVSWTS